MNNELRIMDDKKKIHFFTDLDSWQEAHKLVIMVYKITKSFPREELYGLTNQMRRAVISTTSNVAEGFSRQSYAEKVQFYSIAQGSNTELQNQILASKDLDYINQETFDILFKQSIIAHKLLNGLIKKSKSIHNS